MWMMIGIVYHDEYNKYDLGLNHPLLGDKPRLIIEFLRENLLLHNIVLFTPERANENQLLRVHDEHYVNRVKQLSEKGGLLAIDTPAPKGIFNYAALAVGGSILAGEKLFEGFNVMMNPLAGFHHASRDHSSGFCFFNDIAITIEHIREIYKIRRFMIIDLDVHHGNGTEEIYKADPTVLNLSFHQDGRTLYPRTGDLDYVGEKDGAGFTVNFPLPPKTGSIPYLYAFNEIVPPLVEQYQPELIIYQSGVDTHHSDPLADLLLVYQTYYFLAQNIARLVKNTCDKLLVLFGGGYNSSASIRSYYNIICGLTDQKTFLQEKNPFSQSNYTLVKNRVVELKKILAAYWGF